MFNSVQFGKARKCLEFHCNLNASHSVHFEVQFDRTELLLIRFIISISKNSNILNLEIVKSSNASQSNNAQNGLNR